MPGTYSGTSKYRVIYKYQLHPGRNNIALPRGFRVVMVDTVDDIAYIWIEQFVSDEESLPYIEFDVYATGEPFDATLGFHVGSFKMFGGTFIWHVYQRY